MKRTISIETSQYSTNPTKRWVGQDYVIEDCCVEYPPELDNLEDEELMELADNDDPRVKYVDLPDIHRAQKPYFVTTCETWETENT